MHVKYLKPFEAELIISPALFRRGEMSGMLFRVEITRLGIL